MSSRRKSRRRGWIEDCGERRTPSLICRRHVVQHSWQGHSVGTGNGVESAMTPDENGSGYLGVANVVIQVGAKGWRGSGVSEV